MCVYAPERRADGRCRETRKWIKDFTRLRYDLDIGFFSCMQIGLLHA